MQQNQSERLNVTPWFVTDCTLQLDAESRRIFLFLLYLFIFTAGLLENLLVVWVSWRRRRAAGSGGGGGGGARLCVLNVSLSDLMVTAVLPFFMLEVTLDEVWVWGRVLCKATNLVYFVNFYSSSFFLALMSLERYLALARPRGAPALLAGGGRRRRRALCGGLWAAALLLALLENVHVDLLEWEEPGCYMMPAHSFTQWYVSVALLCLLFQFLGPALLMLTCNLLTARAAAAGAGAGGRGRRVWLLHLYWLVFVACWLPYHGVVLLMLLDELEPRLLSCDAAEALYFSFSVVQSVSLLHCVANPLLYSFLSGSFRRALHGALLDCVPAGDRDRDRDRDQGRAGDLEKERSSTSQSDVSS